MDWNTTFSLLPIVFFAITMTTFVIPLRLRVRAQAIWAMALILCYSKFYCFAKFGGHSFSPDLPELVIWAWNYLYAGAIILMGFALVTVFFRFRAKAWLLPLLAAVLAARGLYNGLSVPAVREVELRFQDLPPSLDGYRIVQLTDLHCSQASCRWRTEAVVAKVNALKPDLVCITGDLSDGTVDKVARHLEPIKDLRARDGVLACTGNHEYYYSPYDWRANFYDQATNVLFLSNACAFPRPGLAVAGVPDKVGQRRSFDEPPDPRQAFAAATNGEFRVLLQHRPGGARENCRDVGVRVQLSGHTHGGIAPLARMLVARMNDGFARGLYPLGASYLYVSPGCGQWGGFPTRFFNGSEITLVVLRRR